MNAIALHHAAFALDEHVNGSACIALPAHSSPTLYTMMLLLDQEVDRVTGQLEFSWWLTTNAQTTADNKHLLAQAMCLHPALAKLRT